MIGSPNLVSSRQIPTHPRRHGSVQHDWYNTSTCGAGRSRFPSDRITASKYAARGEQGSSRREVAGPLRSADSPMSVLLLRPSRSLPDGYGVGTVSVVGGPWIGGSRRRFKLDRSGCRDAVRGGIEAVRRILSAYWQARTRLSATSRGCALHSAVQGYKAFRRARIMSALAGPLPQEQSLSFYRFGSGIC